MQQSLHLHLFIIHSRYPLQWKYLFSYRYITISLVWFQVKLQILAREPEFRALVSSLKTCRFWQKLGCMGLYGQNKKIFRAKYCPSTLQASTLWIYFHVSVFSFDPDLQMRKHLNLKPLGSKHSKICFLNLSTQQNIHFLSSICYIKHNLVFLESIYCLHVQ